jgi:hypothetical protein
METGVNVLKKERLMKKKFLTYNMKGLCHKCHSSNVEVNYKIICRECFKNDN